jgi:tetratricopeptide (TPR) repeat protein
VWADFFLPWGGQRVSLLALDIQNSEERKSVRAAAAILAALVLLSGNLSAAAMPGSALPRSPRTQGPVSGPSQLNVQSRPQLFATMCALYAAGYGQDLNFAKSHPLREKIAQQMAAASGPAADALRQFYRDHALADQAESLSRYISFAMVVGAPPKFAYTISHDDLPPDVLTIEGFNDVLAAFSAEQHLDQLWRNVQADYNREIEKLSSPVRQIVLTSTGYLRELIQSRSERTFSVFVEPLVGEKTNFRNYGVHYDIVVSVGGDPPLDDIRHAFLHYLLEPIVLKNVLIVAQKRALLQVAARAPRLPEEYRQDFIPLFIECFVRAVELRLRRLPPDRMNAALNEADTDGFVLMRPIVRELMNFEKTEPAMSLYFTDLVKAIDVSAETKRLQAVVFAPAEKALPADSASEPKPAQTMAGMPEDLARLLEEGNTALRAQDGPSARSAFKRALDKYPGQPRAMFGLAVASVLEGDADGARDLFQKLLAGAGEGTGSGSQPDPIVLAWSHVYLGHIYDADQKRESALKEYQAALEVDGAPKGAIDAANRGLKEPFGPPPKTPKSGQPDEKPIMPPDAS